MYYNFYITKPPIVPFHSKQSSSSKKIPTNRPPRKYQELSTRGGLNRRKISTYIYIWRDIVAGGNERKRSVCSRERKLDDRSGALEINKRHRGLGGRMRVRWKLVVAGNRINLHKSRSFFARFPHRLLLHHFETRKEEVLVNMAYQIVRPSGIRSFIFFCSCSVYVLYFKILLLVFSFFF